MESGDVANPFDDAAVASRYEGWYARRGRRADELETELLEKMLGRFPAAESILEVGCGTGHFTRWFAQKGFDVVGLDVSEAMLREARRLGGPTNYLRADALSLPFADRSYDLTTMITTLEFLADPVRALAEAARVARQGLLLGVLNRWSVLALRYRLSRNPLWRSARFFGPRELATLVRQAAGRRCDAVTWRTTLWPVPGVHHSSLPWGGFIGMAVPLQETAKPS
jgi:ubiquinone/menaquinone biosynthesis C-methylase UbiE